MNNADFIILSEMCALGMHLQQYVGTLRKNGQIV